jgi:prepilin-type N-terminal cleavage/methylation domain-containing protein
MISKNIGELRKSGETKRGFSIIELVVVVVIIGVLSAISLPYIYNYRRVYRSEEQSMMIMDLMKETSQNALTRRRTYRFEIDLTAGKYLIIDEKGAGAADDTAIKEIPMVSADDIRVDQAPSGVYKPSPPNYNDAVFATDVTGHKSGGASVINHKVWAARFQSSGTVVSSEGTPISATLFIWSPLSPENSQARTKEEVRAVTIFGGSGAVRYWKYDGTNFLPYR